MFDPNAASSEDSGIFGLPEEAPHTEKAASLVLIPVPWEATTSYGGGTSKGPSAILDASRQVDLFDLNFGKPYEQGLCMLPESAKVKAWNKLARTAAKPVIAAGGQIGKSKPLAKCLKATNDLSEKLNSWVEAETTRLLKAGKKVGIVGGDHSVPLGAIRAASKQHDKFGVLHFDAHSDTRKAFEGFTYSHASIMRNVLERIPEVAPLVQVGIRDFCEEEFEFTKRHGDRVVTFYDRELSKSLYEGSTWDQLCHRIVSYLPEKVWISFDIDAFHAGLCPNTGTPVPGGLDFNQVIYLFTHLKRMQKQIIGFDLVEVAPDPKGLNEWDANVGARLLYALCGLCAQCDEGALPNKDTQ